MKYTIFTFLMIMALLASTTVAAEPVRVTSGMGESSCLLMLKNSPGRVGGYLRGFLDVRNTYLTGKAPQLVVDERFIEIMWNLCSENPEMPLFIASGAMDMVMRDEAKKEANKKDTAF